MLVADNVQGPFLAASAFDTTRARRVDVVSETKPVSRWLADTFRTAYQAKGGNVVLNRDVLGGDGLKDNAYISSAGPARRGEAKADGHGCRERHREPHIAR